MKPKIKEVIVVEGKDDTRRLLEVVEADTIETNGSAIDLVVLNQIRFAQEVRGVIILTDPDFPGEKIRKTIMQAVPEAKHAFISAREGAPRKKGSLGVEHASDEAILHALADVMTPRSHEEEMTEIPISLLFEYGLLAGPNARERREKLGIYLHIGYTNGKQLGKRLKIFRISLEKLQEAMAELLEEERKNE